MNFNPYAAPGSSDSDEPASDVVDGVTGDRVLPPFASARTRAKITTGLLVASVICSAALGFAGFSQAALFDRAMKGETITAPEALANDSRIQLLSFAKIGISLACVVVFLAWLYRSHGNLQALGSESLEFTPGWAIGWWFVPFANLVRPYQVVREIWLASDPKFVGDKAWRWRTEAASPLILAWWLCWLGSSFAIRIASRINSAAGNNELGKLRDASNIGACTEMAAIIPAVLLIVLVWDIDQRQQRAHEKLCGLIDGPASGEPAAP